MPAKVTEARLIFKTPPPLRGFARPGERSPEPDQLVMRIDPGAAIRLQLEARRADSPGPQPITLDMEFAEEGGEGPSPYEVLLTAAMAGDEPALHAPGGRWSSSGGSCSRCSTRPRPCSPTRRGRPGRPPPTPWPRSHGGWRGPLDAAVTALDAPHTAARPSEAP